MLIRILSDLHLEFDRAIYNTYLLPSLDQDAQTTLVLAGDIDLYKRLPDFLETISHRFKHVVYTPGNHEVYGNCILDGDAFLSSLPFENFYYLNNKSIILDGVKFIGTRLWTELSTDLKLLNLVTASMNDFRLIKYGGKNLNPKSWISLYKKALNFIRVELENPEVPTVVLTHHAPSIRSVLPIYKEDPISIAFYTELSQFILENNPNLWIHGHVHNSCDYYIADTRVLCNPRGYFGTSLNKEFNPFLSVEI